MQNAAIVVRSNPTCLIFERWRSERGEGSVGSVGMDESTVGPLLDKNTYPPPHSCGRPFPSTHPSLVGRRARGTISPKTLLASSSPRQ